MLTNIKLAHLFIFYFDHYRPLESSPSYFELLFFIVLFFIGFIVFCA